MHYTTQYNRGKLNVDHPQLEVGISEQRIGRKRFDMHKNEESSGLSYGYGLSLPSKNQSVEDIDNKPTAKSENYYKPQVRQMDYKNDGYYKENPLNNPNKSLEEVKFTEGSGYKDYSENKLANRQEDPRYDEQNYRNPPYGNQSNIESYGKYNEMSLGKGNDMNYQGYGEAGYGKIESQLGKYNENSNPKLQEAGYYKVQADNHLGKYNDNYYTKPQVDNQVEKYNENPYLKQQEQGYYKPQTDSQLAKYNENSYLKQEQGYYKPQPNSQLVNYNENPYLKPQEQGYYKPQTDSQLAKYNENPPIKTQDPKDSYGKDPENQEKIQETYEDNKYPDYTDEIEKLKHELKKKEEELAIYQLSLQDKSIANMNPDEAAIYSRINKAMFDKYRIEEQRKITVSSLESQLTEKSKLKMMEQLAKEREQFIRLEMLKKIKEDEMRERYEKSLKAKEYRDQLEVQSIVKSNINHQERIIYKNDIPKPIESPPPPVDGITRNNSTVSHVPFSPGTYKFTKKTPKTICYNPITGVLKDTSQYVVGPFPHFNIKDPSITYLKNQSNVPDLAVHPAFQQHKFTKSHPKVVPTNPYNGSGQEVREIKEPENYKPGEGRMAEYGSLMMQNRPPQQYN
ncbi:hypothetical protein SteCoe_37021 [Stentor coeruleus]|uniref:Uncharacterized protein n=1 Tax=Stentor coeruleus TaxID=5963 RepID=A0A1R2ANW9_9CILI|nr:hypothetical protein SteCoe_37021 [Stentor coeruleus]